MRNTILTLAFAFAMAGCTTQKAELAQIRFLHWNVAQFSGGGAKAATIKEADGPAMAARFRSFVDASGADVIGVTQYGENFTTNGSLKSADAVFKGYEKSVGPKKGAQCNAVFFKPGVATLAEEKDVFYAEHFEKTYYKAAKLVIKGVPVWFVQTQLDCHNYLMGHHADRANQMKELIAAFREEPNVVIAGDFRVGIRIPGGRCFPAPEEYDVFEKAGYELVNLHGTGTYPVTNPLQPVDNIIVKGLSISDVRFLEADRLSDHMALSCVLTVHPK